MTKFVGKFRKNKDYNDDYNFASNRKHKSEHAEIKKLLKTRNVEDLLESEEYDDASLPQISKDY